MEEEKKTYEARLARLQQIVTKIENEVLPLEETLSLYQEGQRLIQELGDELAAAEEMLAKAEAKE